MEKLRIFLFGIFASVLSCATAYGARERMEKAREFDPFGHAGLPPSGIIRLTPSGKIKMTPVDDTAGEFFCSFENPCPGTAGFNVKYYKI